MTEFTQPIYDSRGGVYSYEWPTFAIRILLDRLKDGDSGPVAEFNVRSSVNGTDRHVHRARLNLLNPSARLGLERRLAERMPPLRDYWPALLEYVCEHTLQVYRQGEPVVSLWDVEAPESLVYRFRPLLHEGAINLIFGAPGSLKSWLALWIAFCIHVPVDGWEAEPGKVLYLDYERDGKLNRRRLGAISEGLGITGDRSRLFYRRCYYRLIDDLPEIQRLVLEQGIDFLVVDSAGGASGGDVLDNGEAIRCMLGLRSLGITVLVLAHEPKNAPDKSPFGASYWTNYPSSVWHVRCDQEPGSDHADLGLYHHKVNDGRYLKPTGMSFDFVNDTDDRLVSVAIRRSNIMDSFNLSKPTSIVARAIYILKTHTSLTTKELASELDEKEDSVRGKLNKHKNIFLRQGEQWVLISTQDKGA